MKRFRYEGLLNGKRVEGELTARDRTDALRQLEAKGVIPLSVEPAGGGDSPFSKIKVKAPKGGVGEEELAFALLQLATLLEAGIPLTKALELLASQVENERLSAALLQVKGGVEAGEPVAEAFAKTGLFPQFLVEMLRGVQTGENLEYIFRIAGEYLERIAEIKGRIWGAVSYPAFVIAFSFAAVLIAVKFVVPKLASVLQSFGKDLPLITKLIIWGVNGAFSLLLMSPIFALLYWKRERFIDPAVWDRFLLRLPVVGRIILYFNLSRFAKVLSMLLKAAVPLDEALRLAVNSLSNRFLKGELQKVIPQVERGKSFSSLLRDFDFLPPLFVNLVETGERSGELERMLDLIARSFEKETFRVIDFWVRMVEPLAILLIAVVVGIVVVSVMLPLAEISTGVGVR